MFMFKSYISPTRSHSAMEYKIYHAAISQQPFHSSASALKRSRRSLKALLSPFIS